MLTDEQRQMLKEQDQRIADNMKRIKHRIVVFSGKGGVGAIEHWHNRGIIKMLTEAHRMGKLVCAICLAPVTLTNAGLLKGRKATAYESAASYLRSIGATYTGKLVEIADNIITAHGPGASKGFATTIINSLRR